MTEVVAPVKTVVIELEAYERLNHGSMLYIAKICATICPIKMSARIVTTIELLLRLNTEPKKKAKPVAPKIKSTIKPSDNQILSKIAPVITCDKMATIR